jgi:hypothetical protein
MFSSRNQAFAFAPAQQRTQRRYVPCSGRGRLSTAEAQQDRPVCRDWNSKYVTGAQMSLKCVDGEPIRPNG